MATSVATSAYGGNPAVCVMNMHPASPSNPGSRAAPLPLLVALMAQRMPGNQMSALMR